jgi:hypothetical protein
LERVNEAIAISGAEAVFATWHQRIFEDCLNAGSRWCDEQFGPERPWKKEN